MKKNGWWKITLLFWILTGLVPTTIMAQEICDNAIDDDNDGLIDLNDPECTCNALLPSSLIPNPSFEEMSCCPTENARLDCALYWIQASAPTTDYVHTCGGYLGNTSIPAYAPLPFPDGEGAVGFRDGQVHAGPNYKEYVGACLTRAMTPGTSYRLDFYVGFRDNVFGSQQFEIAIYGSVDCADLPFGGQSNSIGCPVNTGKYVLIDEKPVNGSNEWVNVVFEFEADQAYEVIILGPGCTTNPYYTYDPYFYVDRLVLAESSEFGIPFDRIEGKICEEGIRLNLQGGEQESYQWYQDGIAIPGAVEPALYIAPGPAAEGIYMCVISNPLGCTFSRTYDLRMPPYIASLSDTICEFDIYPFGTEMLSQSGYYQRTISATDGCDSIIQLQLEVLPASYAELKDTFCAGDSWNYYDLFASAGGIYATTLINSLGCDSLVTIDLKEIPRGNGIRLRDTVELALGESLDLKPDHMDPSYTGFRWLDKTGNILTDQITLSGLQPLESGIYYFSARDGFGCPVVDSTLVLVRTNDYQLFIPNIFSPNGDRINDVFNFPLPLSVESIIRMSVFDRWGNKVFEDTQLAGTGTDWGWDGLFYGKDAISGVYIYVIEVRYIDGTIKQYAGDITLIR